MTYWNVGELILIMVAATICLSMLVLILSAEVKSIIKVLRGEE